MTAKLIDVITCMSGYVLSGYVAVHKPFMAMMGNQYLFQTDIETGLLLAGEPLMSVKGDESRSRTPDTAAELSGGIMNIIPTVHTALGCMDHKHVFRLPGTTCLWHLPSSLCFTVLLAYCLIILESRRTWKS